MNKISRLFLLFFFISLYFSCGSSKRLNESRLNAIPFEEKENYSATYEEVISFYKSLEKASDFVRVNEFGMSDIGEPLHEVIIDYDKDFDIEKTRKKNKVVVFINNGIHAGEPCGIDASMMMARDLLRDRSYFDLLQNVVVVIVPVYNIGGSKNRGSYSRANQNGPEEHGFRGNAKNLDLNRDFIKCDSKNAQSFNQLFTKWMPEVFIDTHTSNGADYQHIITLISTQKDKLAPALGGYLEFEFLPKIYSAMKEDGYDMSPYVFSRGKTPDEKGIMAFPDLPRYSSGYAALHHSLSFMPETHMLKEYKDRVESTKTLLTRMVELSHLEAENILKRKKESIQEYRDMVQVPIQWKLDEDLVGTADFKGYTSEMKESEISGQDRLFYNRDKPFEKDIPLYNSFETSLSVSVPKQYIIPQAYSAIIDRLVWNGVEYTELEEDIEMEVELYYIEDYETRKTPYEGHYLHYNTQVKKAMQEVQYYKGDYIINVDQKTKRFIIETLEPQAPDSYFNWNFMDGILMQKEYFSPYVFEDLAVELLRNDPDLQMLLNAKKDSDPEFAKNAYQQLEFIYKRSPYYEKTHMRYPIARVIK